MTSSYFLKMIRNLRQYEEVLLYGNILETGEDADVIDLLRSEYRRESAEYPYIPPDFDADAALWAAKTVYIAAQLILYRDGEPKDLTKLLPDFTGTETPAAILSADLCLRFLPDMIVQLQLIDPEDALLSVLERILTQWHYSGIRYTLSTDLLRLDTITSDACLLQLYADRVIQHRKLHLAALPALKTSVAASLGMYARELWNDFKTETTIHE